MTPISLFTGLRVLTDDECESKIHTRGRRSVLAPFAIYILLPALGVAVYLVLIWRMRRIGVPSPPRLAYFVLFFTVGGWLQVLLTVWLWEWSGMASLGVFYLIIIAPLLTSLIAWRLRRQRTLSAFHKCAFLLCGLYSCLIAVGLPVAIYMRYIAG